MDENPFLAAISTNVPVADTTDIQHELVLFDLGWRDLGAVDADGVQ